MNNYKLYYEQLYVLDSFIVKPIDFEYLAVYKKSLQRLDLHRFSFNEITCCELILLKGILLNFYKNEFITTATYLDYLNCIACIENSKN